MLRVAVLFLLTVASAFADRDCDTRVEHGWRALSVVSLASGQLSRGNLAHHLGSILTQTVSGPGLELVVVVYNEEPLSEGPEDNDQSRAALAEENRHTVEILQWVAGDRDESAALVSRPERERAVFETARRAALRVVVMDRTQGETQYDDLAPLQNAGLRSVLGMHLAESDRVIVMSDASVVFTENFFESVTTQFRDGKLAVGYFPVDYHLCFEKLVSQLPRYQVSRYLRFQNHLVGAVVYAGGGYPRFDDIQCAATAATFRRLGEIRKKYPHANHLSGALAHLGRFRFINDVRVQTPNEGPLIWSANESDVAMLPLAKIRLRETLLGAAITHLYERKNNVVTDDERREVFEFLDYDYSPEQWLAAVEETARNGRWPDRDASTVAVLGYLRPPVAKALPERDRFRVELWRLLDKHVPAEELKRFKTWYMAEIVRARATHNRVLQTLLPDEIARFAELQEKFPDLYQPFDETPAKQYAEESRIVAKMLVSLRDDPERFPETTKFFRRLFELTKLRG